MVSQGDSILQTRSTPPRRILRSRVGVMLLAVFIILGSGLLIRVLPGDWSLTTEQKKAFNSDPKTAQSVLVEQDQQPLFDSDQWRLESRYSASSGANSNPQAHADL